jgi:hypothetical protein
MLTLGRVAKEFAKLSLNMKEVLGILLTGSASQGTESARGLDPIPASQNG